VASIDRSLEAFMKLVLAAAAALSLSVALPVVSPGQSAAQAQDGKWKPYEFRGDERYEYELTMEDGSGAPKQTGFLLDIRKRSGEEFEVTWSVRSLVTREELSQQSLLETWASTVPAAAILTPVYAMFADQLELREGEKMSVMGAGTVKVVGKERIGERTGFVCQFSSKPDGGEEVLTWEWTIDPELALPIKSIVYENGKEQSRAELVEYTRK
jgi:hypothetical protein